MPGLLASTTMHPKQELHESGNPTCLGRLPGNRRGYSAHGRRKASLPLAERNDREGLRGRKGKARDAVHPLSRLEKSAALSHAFVCMHEFKEVGLMEMEGTGFRSFFASLKKFRFPIRQF